MVILLAIVNGTQSNKFNSYLSKNCHLSKHRSLNNRCKEVLVCYKMRGNRVSKYNFGSFVLDLGSCETINIHSKRSTSRSLFEKSILSKKIISAKDLKKVIREMMKNTKDITRKTIVSSNFLPKKLKTAVNNLRKKSTQV